MQETRYNGPEMSAKKVIILLVTAALILILFLTRTCKQDPVADAPAEEEVQPKPQDYIYISPFDSLFRLYADSVCDWGVQVRYHRPFTPRCTGSDADHALNISPSASQDGCGRYNGAERGT